MVDTIIVSGDVVECRQGKKCKTEEERRLRKNAAQKRWMEKNRNRAREIMLKHRTKTNPNSGRKEALKKYGMTIKDYNKMYEEQKGLCLICKKKYPNGTNRGLVVDHCHDTGKVRGLLCNQCNQAIGMLKHDRSIIQNAKEYIENGGFS